MKSVLISIQPKWVEKIVSGEKTIEVRKTKPSVELPFKGLIYCTKANKNYDLYINEPSVREQHGIFSRLRAGQEDVIKTIESFDTFLANGKVIGEFICNKIGTLVYDDTTFRYPYYYGFGSLGGTAKACLTADELLAYGKGKTLYGWHISNLVIYDKPKELGEFKRPCNKEHDCGFCIRYDYMGHKCFDELTRPPQSYCYVEEL